MQISAGIAAQLAATKQNFALSSIKQSAEADKAVANVLAESVDNVRGKNLDIRV